MKKAVTDPEILSCVAKIIFDKIKDEKIDKIAGPALGAVPIATAVSLYSGIPMLMIRKSLKDYGTSKLIEGELQEGDRVVVVEDVTTTGNSLLKAIKAVSDNGGRMLRAFVVVDREEGAENNLRSQGVILESLVSINDFNVNLVFLIIFIEFIDKLAYVVAFPGSISFQYGFIFISFIQPYHLII